MRVLKKKHSKTKICSILCCLRFLKLADWSYKIKIRILWIVFRYLQWSYYQLCVVCILIKLQFINKFLQAINQSQKNMSTFYMAVLALKHTLHNTKTRKESGYATGTTVWFNDGAVYIISRYLCALRFFKNSTDIFGFQKWTLLWFKAGQALVMRKLMFFSISS